MADAQWLIPDWPAPAHVHALFTTRGASPADGASAAPFAHLNLGDHVGDAPAAVAANRARLTQALGGARPVFLNQVHGTVVSVLDAGQPDGHTADAAVTHRPGLACTVMVADCLPVLFTNATGTVVAAAHAGWRGLVGGVLQATLASFKALALEQNARAAIKTEADEVLAWLGPCIGPRSFEVGAEVRDAFLATDAGVAACFVPQGAGKYLADLPGLARRVLAGQGVRAVHGNDGSDAWCTVQGAQRFHSYRRDQATLGGSGRMAACIWLEPSAAPQVPAAPQP